MGLAATAVAARAGTYQQVFDLTADAGDATGNSAAIPHALGVVPTEWKIVDTDALLAENTMTHWSIHTLTANDFIFRRVKVQAGGGAGSTSARLWIRRAHTMGTGRTTW